jgi:FKBP-type peptidyl-prolyl cis-trans isomerase SlyD
MRTSQLGDRIKVHYIKRFEEGAVRSSRVDDNHPLEVVIGSNHPRLPGLGDRLVGLSIGDIVTVRVPAEMAHGIPDPARVRRADRARFPAEEDLTPGKRVLMRLKGGRTRRVRVVEVLDGSVVVDTNHPLCGQAVVMEVELVAILNVEPDAPHWDA